MESSGFQGVQGSLQTQIKSKIEQQEFESVLANQAKKNAARAKKAAGQFKIAMAIGTIATMGAAAKFGAAAGAEASKASLLAASKQHAASGIAATATEFAGYTATASLARTAATAAFGSTPLGTGLSMAGAGFTSLGYYNDIITGASLPNINSSFGGQPPSQLRYS
jgi:hypothetical protein